MKKIFLIMALLLLILTAACTANGGRAADTSGPDGTSPAGMPARPGSGVTGDPSAHLDELMEVSGTVLEVNDDLVLMTLEDGSEYMLRFSESSQWDDGVSKEILTDNVVTCLVKPEPTLTTPSQGEVIEVISNQGVS